MSKIKIFRNITELLTLKASAQKQGRKVQEKDLSIIKNACMIVKGKKILWLGSEKKFNKDLLNKLNVNSFVHEYNLKTYTVLPAFVECHTHLIFAGDRSNEFELRNQGVSYQQIASQGGGILSTVKSTRRAGEKDLLQLAQQRVDNFVRQGVATIEVKSGYALNEKNELKMLRVAAQLKTARIVPTYLGAHSKPNELSWNEYLDQMIESTMLKVAKKTLAGRVDIFIEDGYFNLKMAERYFRRAQELGLDIVVHADQLTRSGATQLALKYQARSVDHLVQINKKDIKQLALSNSTCVLLPGADFYLKMNYPPARDLIDQGARIALASDFNPGSSPTQNIGLIGLLSRLEMKMTLAEVIVAYTLGASYALGLEREIGSLEAGKHSDFMILDGNWQNLFYSSEGPKVKELWRSGQRIYKNLKKS